MIQDDLASSPKIAYVIKRFPHLSETFILHEVLELERQGLPLRIFSLLEPTGKVNEAAKEVRAPIEYVPHGFPLGTLKLLGAAIRQFRKRPTRFLAACFEAIIRFHHLATPGHLLRAAFVAEQVEREGITHLHAHYANTPTTIARHVHKFTGIPYTFTAHAKDIYLSQRVSLAYKMSDARFVVTCTEYNRQYLSSVEDRDGTVPIHRIYHGLDLSRLPADTSHHSSERVRPLILCVARLVEKKGLPYLLKACSILQAQCYDFDCRIVGEGPQRPALERQIRDLGLSERVTLWGAEKHEQVIEMYRQATLLALPCIISRDGDRDGIPNVLVESLYMGVPVVSTAVSGVPELIRSEDNGLLVRERDANRLAEAIRRLLESPRLRARLAAAGKRTVLEGFDMSANAQRLMQLFLDLQRKDGQPGAEPEAEAVLIPADLQTEKADTFARFRA